MEDEEALGQLALPVDVAYNAVLLLLLDDAVNGSGVADLAALCDRNIQHVQRVVSHLVVDHSRFAAFEAVQARSV
jgi:hypothetical protein